jgi:hypothetical protein
MRKTMQKKKGVTQQTLRLLHRSKVQPLIA